MLGGGIMLYEISGLGFLEGAVPPSILMLPTGAGTALSSFLSL